MSLFNNFFKGKGEEKPKDEKVKHLNWIPLTNVNQLKEIKSLSNVEPIFIFKHSTRCGISSMVIKQFEKLFTEEHQKIKVYYLDLLNHRDISNEIAAQFQVMHQSPQLVVVKNGVTVHHASHYDITLTELSRFI